jgi:hypothetical protein
MSARVIIPEPLSKSSRMRRRRVMSRGDPGVRRKPRSFSAFASASMLTLPVDEDAMRSRATVTTSSCGAV